MPHVNPTQCAKSVANQIMDSVSTESGHEIAAALFALSQQNSSPALNQLAMEVAAAANQKGLQGKQPGI